MKSTMTPPNGILFLPFEFEKDWPTKERGNEIYTDISLIAASKRIGE
jgi:hypothetical protein